MSTAISCSGENLSAGYSRGKHHESQNATFPLVVMKGQGLSLFGRYWLQHINHLSTTSLSSHLFKSYLRSILVFHEEFETFEGTKAKIIVPPNAQPCFFKPRPLHYAFKNLTVFSYHNCPVFSTYCSCCQDRWYHSCLW